MGRLVSFLLLALLIPIFTGGYEGYAQLESKPDFIFAISPMVSPTATAEDFAEFVNYLSRRLNKKVILKQRRKYSEVNKLLEEGQADLAFVCTGAYLLGRQQFGLEPLAVPIINGKTTYHSYIIVHRNSPIKDLAGLRGKNFAFTDPLSLTGRLYVLSLLNEKGIQSKDYFAKTFYTGGHDKSIEAVATGLADGASVDSLILEDLKRKRHLSALEVKVIRASPPFGMPPFVVSPKLTPSEKKSLLKVLLHMSKDPQGKKVLQRMGIDGFTLPNHAHYLSALEVQKKVIE